MTKNFTIAFRSSFYISLHLLLQKPLRQSMSSEVSKKQINISYSSGRLTERASFFLPERQNPTGRAMLSSSFEIFLVIRRFLKIDWQALSNPNKGNFLTGMIESVSQARYQKKKCKSACLGYSLFFFLNTRNR